MQYKNVCLFKYKRRHEYIVLTKSEAGSDVHSGNVSRKYVLITS